MAKNVLTDLNVNYDSGHISLSYDFMSTNFHMTMQFDELPKPIEKMKFQELRAFAWKKLKKKLKCYLDK